MNLHSIAALSNGKLAKPCASDESVRRTFHSEPWDCPFCQVDANLVALRSNVGFYEFPVADVRGRTG